MLTVVSVFHQLIPRLLTHRSPDTVLLRLLPSFAVAYKVLYWISYPVTGVLAKLTAKNRTHEPEEETTDEEIQAYLGVGEEEGIFESTETRLIQSALEFGDTLVREIMTPRSEIVGIEENATLSELRNVMVTTKHSRIPVYRDTLDQIIGMAHVRNLLSHMEIGSKEESISPIVQEILVVPETKHVSPLLTELQEQAQQMAIVANEYGTVSGLVTVEDLLEEIVGEIHDEDESRRIDMVYEGAGQYVVRGGIEIDDLEEALGIHYGEHDASTVSGLVVDRLGKVPNPGETIVLDGTRIEILSSDRKRIHKLRVSVLAES
jgi:CBS domain containing-hemolysin-like protein